MNLLSELNFSRAPGTHVRAPEVGSSARRREHAGLRRREKKIMFQFGLTRPAMRLSPRAPDRNARARCVFNRILTYSPGDSGAPARSMSAISGRSRRRGDVRGRGKRERGRAQDRIARRRGEKRPPAGRGDGAETEKISAAERAPIKSDVPRLGTAAGGIAWERLN